MLYFGNDETTDPRVVWYEGDSILEKEMRLDKGLDVFTK